MTRYGRTAEEDLRIAAHEAGHAILGWYNGRSIVTVTIEPDISSDGTARNGHVVYGVPIDDDWNSDIFARIVEDVAGAAAEKIYPCISKPLKASDKKKAYLRTGALVVSDLAADLLVAAAEVDAGNILREHYPILDAMTSELLRCRTMDGQTALEFLDRCSCEMSALSAVDTSSAPGSDFRQHADSLEDASAAQLAPSSAASVGV
ncbi:hypothetical protein [Bradyrhizobium sp. USDA 4471]